MHFKQIKFPKNIKKITPKNENNREISFLSGYTLRLRETNFVVGNSIFRTNAFRTEILALVQFCVYLYVHRILYKISAPLDLVPQQHCEMSSNRYSCTKHTRRVVLFLRSWAYLWTLSLPPP